ncbi:MAG: hypothetical protein K6G28_01215 [Acholeplasmatales bacterium]|nr:hypothetical protein [Acholeplasmatales bacterium]
MKEINHYYTDEVNTEFSGITRKKVIVDKDFPFVHRNPIWKICEYILYYIIIYPVAYLYSLIHLRQKIVGKKKLRGFKGQYFMYGNHTQVPGDGMMPPRIMFPRKVFDLVSPDNIAVKGTKNILLMVGALPIPNDIHGIKPFEKAIEYRIKHHQPICIYPEAHIWPYYTGIRNFKSVSFRYPIKLDKPVFCFTNTYKKTRFFKRPKLVTYVDGPFYPNKELSSKEQVEDLRNQVYNTMKERSLNSNYEYKHHYIKEEEHV